jgi:hypothetical protein
MRKNVGTHDQHDNDRRWIAVVGILDEKQQDRTHYGFIDSVTQETICIDINNKKMDFNMDLVREIFVFRM